MPGFVAHDPELKARARAALAAGTSPNQIARDLELPVSTVKSWKRDLLRQNPDLDLDEPARGGEPGGPLDLAEYVRDDLAADLRIKRGIARALNDREWLKKQSAAGLAQLLREVNTNKQWTVTAVTTGADYAPLSGPADADYALIPPPASDHDPEDAPPGD